MIACYPILNKVSILLKLNIDYLISQEYLEFTNLLNGPHGLLALVPDFMHTH